MDISTIVSILEDIENENETIKLVFRKKLNYHNKEEKLFIFLQKYCQIRYTMINSEEEVSPWAESVLREITRLIEKKQGRSTVEVVHDDLLDVLYEDWQKRGSTRKKEVIQQMLLVLEVQKQGLLKDEYEKMLSVFEEQTDTVFK